MSLSVKFAQLCPILWDPMVYSVHGILQARILEWVAFPFSRGSSQPKHRTEFYSHYRQILYQLSHKGSPRILEWVAYPFSSGSSRPRNWTGVSCIVGRFFTNWAMREAPYCFSSFGKTEITCFSCIQWQLQFIYYCTLNALILQDTPYTLTHLFSFFLRSNKLSLMYYHFSILINLWDMYLTQIGRTS